MKPDAPGILQHEPRQCHLEFMPSGNKKKLLHSVYSGFWPHFLGTKTNLNQWYKQNTTTQSCPVGTSDYNVLASSKHQKGSRKCNYAYQRWLCVSKDYTLSDGLPVTTQIQHQNACNVFWKMRMFRTNRERFDVPLHHILLWHPLGTACAGLELRWVGITGHWHQNGHIVGSWPALKLTTSLQC